MGRGRNSHSDRLRRLGQVRSDLRKVVYAAADELAADAALSITAGSVSGAGHVPSAPGEPPNEDTGMLSRSIHVRQIDDLKAQVVADAPYAAALEFGTSKMAERPYMRPAALRVAPVMRKKITEIIKRKLR